MKSFINFIVFIVLWLFLANSIFGQSVYSRCPDYQIDIRKTGNQSTVSQGGLKHIADCNTTFGYSIGKNGSTRMRGIYQWDISEIPDGSTINSITLEFSYEVYYYDECNLEYFNVGLDITLPNLDLDELYDSTNYTQTGIGYGFGSQFTNHIVSTTFTGQQDPFIKAFKNSLAEGFFTLGVAWRYDGPNAGDAQWTVYPTINTITVDYTLPNQPVTIDQRLSTGQQVGVLRKWEGNQFSDPPFNPGTQFNFPVTSLQTILGDQTIISNQKYNNWNELPDVTNFHKFTINSGTTLLLSNFNPIYSGITIKNSLEGTTADGGSVQFADPWFIDYPDPQFGNTRRNRGMNDAVWRTRPSPFNPNYNDPYEYGQAYQGVFLEQDPNFLPDIPNYSVGSVEGQTISVHNQDRKFYHYKWDGTDVSFQNPNAVQTGVVFHTVNSVATDVLKGNLMSDDQNGISSSSQRKMVRTDNGIYHVVYESMGNVWYTYSLTANFQGDWSEDEMVLPDAKNPSLDYEGNTIKIVCEIHYSGDAQIWLLTYEPQSNGGYENTEVEVVTTYPDSYFGNAKPVISYTNDAIFIAYRKNTTEGIKQRTKFNNNGWYWDSEATIPGTGQYSSDPSIAGNNTEVHIVFAKPGKIMYEMAYMQGYNWLFAYLSDISNGSGFKTNKYPSISFSHNQHLYAIISWLGIYDAAMQKRSAKQQGGITPFRRYAAVTKVGSGSYWGSFNNFGDNVEYTNNNSINSDPGSIISWSEQNGQYSKFVKRLGSGTYDAVQPLSTNGIQPFVSNGSSFQDIKAMVFNTSTSAPYLLNKCTNDFSLQSLAKSNEDETIDLSYGRSGVIEKEGIEFLFNVGDILVDGEAVKFVVRADTLPVNTIEELNSAVVTEPFYLNQQTELIFSNYYYVVNPDWADSLLSNDFSVNFKCELVKASTNEIVGTFDNITYNKTNVEEYDNPGFLVDCSGIEQGNYYFRLTTTLNDEANLYLTDIQRDNYLLQKGNLIGRTFKGEPIPQVYALEQNYPNPFNPSTTIRYQLPQDGFVTLKIYDILGREVTTLVNEEKTKGRYEVNFNASSLASGVYLYRIKVNDYVAVKKMLMLK